MRNLKPGEVSPKAITDIERVWMNRTPAEYDWLQDQLMTVGSGPGQAGRIVWHLKLLAKDPRRAIDGSSSVTRWEWRQRLTAVGEPPQRPRAQAGRAGIATLGATAVVGGVAFAGHPTAALALAASFVITVSDSDEVELPLAA